MKQPRWLALPLASVLALAAACGDDGGGDGTAGPGSPSPEFGTIVGYDSEDGVSIVAEFDAPEGVQDPPIVILLHQFQGSRRQWKPLVRPLLDAGYAVLAPDLRTFGDSTRCLRDGREELCRLDNLDDLLNDVAAALAYLGARQDLETERIAVIGASVGGNLAYVASGAFAEVDTAVSMSPSASPRGGALLGRGIPDFTPHSVLFMSDEAEAADARTLAENATAPVEVKVYDGVSAHGVELLEAATQAVQDILDWLEETL